MIQDGVRGRISFREILDCLKVDFIQRPKGFMDFYFFSKCCSYLGLKMQSLLGLDGRDFSFE